MSQLDSKKPDQVSSDAIPLGAMDNLFCAWHDAFDGAGMGAAVMGVRGHIEHEILEAALGNLQLRHPKLRARIIKSADGRRFFDFPTTPSPIPVEFKDYETDSLSWQEELNRLMNPKLDPTVEPLCRGLVLRSRTRPWCYLIILLHHGIADGLSLFRVVNDLLKYYEDAEQHRDKKTVSSLPIVVVHRARQSSHWLRQLALLAHLFRKRRDIRKEMWTSLPHDDSVPPHHLWAHHVFSEQETLALARRCRKEKTTVSGALFAAASCGLIALLPQRNARFKCRFPIDVRGKLEGSNGPVTEDDLGCFVSPYENVYTLDKTSSFWDVARQADSDTKTFVAAGGPSLLYNLARLYKPPLSSKKHKRGTLHIGNYGVIWIRDSYGTLNVEECATLYKSGPSLSLIAIMIQQRMNLTFNIFDVPKDFANQLRDVIFEQLRQAMEKNIP